MKFNKWTLGLAAVGAVSLASVAHAEEKSSMVMTAVSSTVLSGYVDTSIQWNPGTGNANVPGYAFNSNGKADGFNLDAILLRLQKPLDESEWAAGYDVDLFFGPDAAFLGTTSTGALGDSDFVIKQAYVNLRTPLGNGIDWKIGVFDSIIGYESTEAPNNPNYTRSYGYTLEPTTLTGLLGTYKFNELVSIAAGIANTTGPTIGGATVGPNFGGRANPPKAESYKAYMGTVALTAPNSWSFLAGSSLYGGFINGWNPAGSEVQTSLYVGATINTPIKDLKTGISYDYVGVQSQNYLSSIGRLVPEQWANDIALYASYNVTEKLSLHARGEYLWQSHPNEYLFAGNGNGTTVPSKVLALTATVEYDLWKNVLSRLEIRWDHQASGGPAAWGGTFGEGGNAPDKHNSWLIAANIIYKF